MSLFRSGKWSFGSRPSEEYAAPNRGGLEDESFDVGSNLPVYLSRKEAGEWQVPVDENMQAIRIIEDDENDEKMSDIASSVVSGSTIAESRQFWLNCLKENGVDMNASILQPSPRKGYLNSPRFPCSVNIKGAPSPSRSTEPLTPRENEQNAPNLDYTEKNVIKSRGSSSSIQTADKSDTEASQALAVKETPKLVDSSNREASLLQQDRVTAERGRKSLEWEKDTINNKGEPFFKNMGLRRGNYLENQNQTSVHESISRDVLSGKAGDYPSEIVVKASVDSSDSLVGTDLVDTHSRSEDNRDYFPEIRAALTSGTFDTVFTEDEEPSPKIKVTTVTSGDDDDDDEVAAEEKHGHGVKTTAKQNYQPVSTARDVASNRSRALKKDESPLPNPAVDNQKNVGGLLLSEEDNAILKSMKPESEKIMPDDKEQLDDDNTWMYRIWYKKGLMKKIPCPSTAARLQIKTACPAQENKPLATPKEALISLSFNELQPEQEECSSFKPMPRQSLPAPVRESARKEGGRKSFDNIKKMWQEKSHDRPQSYFSPEKYMQSKRRSYVAAGSKPTQHSQLMSITERTGIFENRSSVPVRANWKDVMPRSKSVGRDESFTSASTTGTRMLSETNVSSPVPSRKKGNLTFSPVREMSVDEQLQIPNIKNQSSERRKSLSKSQGREDIVTKPRESINPRDQPRRPHVARSSNDYKSIVRAFLESVEENRVAEGASQVTKNDSESRASDSGRHSVPSVFISTESSTVGPLDTITPRNTSSSSFALRQSAAKDSPWTQQVVNKLEKIPIGSDTKSDAWRRQERPWREDLVKQRVSDFSDNASILPSMEEGPCTCYSSVFSGNDELVEFFLPLMGMACTCGKRPLGLINPEEPTSLENILRPWQVKFLAAFGIQRGDQLVKAHHRSAKALANALRQYRRKRGMTPFRTKSCGMALQIWSKTSKSYVRSIRKQLLSGTSELKVPNTLYIISSFLEKMHETHSPMPRKPNVVYQDEASL